MSTETKNNQIINALRESSVDYRDTKEGIAIKICPECHPDTADPTNQYKLCVELPEGVFFCHRCGFKGNERALVAALLQKSKSETNVYPIRTQQQSDAEILAVQTMFDEALSLDAPEAQVGRNYFDNRGLLIPESRDIKFSPRTRYHDNEGKYRGDLPAIISRMRNSDGVHVCNHLIFLDEKGSKTTFVPAKKFRGKAKSAILILGELSGEMAVVEGLETGLAVYQATGISVIVCFSANGLSDLIVPKEVFRLHLFLDQDSSRTGERAGKTVASRVSSDKVQVYLHLPKKSLLGKKKSVDFLDLLNDGVDLKTFIANKQVYTPATHDWPSPISNEAVCGVIERFLNLVMPSTEADASALIVQFLVMTGIYLGRSVQLINGSIEVLPNLFAVIAGATSTGRKGTGLSEIKRLARIAMPEFSKSCFRSGATSGEGIIFHVRDEVREMRKNKESGQDEEVVVDPGSKDKRMLFTESEFQQILTVGSRPGNNLSAILRAAWDAEPLETASKNSPCKAMEHSIGLIGQITKEELRSSFSSSDMANGFANRILWTMSRRSKMIANPKSIDSHELGLIGMELVRKREFAASVGIIRFSSEAKIHWEHMYVELDRQLSESIYGKIISRNMAQVYRMALIYAVLDESKEVLPKHLSAARAVWEYCMDSAFYLFGDLEGSPVQRRIIAALSDADNGLTKSQIMDVFARHKGANSIDDELEELRRRGVIESVVEPTGGRNATRWFLL